MGFQPVLLGALPWLKLTAGAGFLLMIILFLGHQVWVGKKTGVGAGCLLVLLFPGGVILLAFGGLGLYEDPELLSLNSALAAAGLVLIAIGILGVWMVDRKSEEIKEMNGTSIAFGFFLLCIGTFKLTMKATTGKPFWAVGIAGAGFLFIIYRVVEIFKRRRQQAAAGKSSATDEPHAADEQGDEQGDE